MPPHACENIGEELPVDSISWLDCISFCKKLKQLSGIDFNLPTEAQWFWAAKECNDYACAEIDNIEELAWTKSNSNKSQRPGLKKPNKLGIYDLLGNLHEWCLDRWGEWGNTPLMDPYRPIGSGGNMIRKGGSYSIGKTDIFDQYNINARDFRSETANMNDSGIRLAIFNPNLLNEF
jgi:formylglycine-generating enzyme required for sulfatase activity